MYIVLVALCFFTPYMCMPLQRQFVNKKAEVIFLRSIYWDENAILPMDFSVKHPHCIIEYNPSNGS